MRRATALTSPAMTRRTNCSSLSEFRAAVPLAMALLPFDEHELRVGGAGADLSCRDVVRRVVEPLRALEARELDHHHPALRRRSLERCRASTAGEEMAAELFDDRRR